MDKDNFGNFFRGEASPRDIAKLVEMLQSLLLYRGEEVRKDWNRSLPFADYIVDRWKKASELGFGTGSSIYDSSFVLGDVNVGKNTWIGPFTVLDGTGKLEIGDNCSISAGVQIYTHDTVKWAISGGAEPAEQSPVRIGSNTYIGPDVVISRGVTIGNQCVIGAKSFVNRDITDGKKAWGTPVKVIGESDER